MSDYISVLVHHVFQALYIKLLAIREPLKVGLDPGNHPRL